MRGSQNLFAIKIAESRIGRVIDRLRFHGLQSGGNAGIERRYEQIRKRER